jgi:pimeloyl-ACP methyl ester carboxylesterase
VSRLLRRVALRLYATLFPDRAAAWFERVLLTPRATPPLGLPRPAVPHVSHRLPYGWGWLAVTQWGAEGEPVLLLHGWGGRSESVHAMIAPLVAAGYRAVTLDLPGHGASGGGPRTHLIECAGAALQAGLAFGPFDGIVTQSFGGPVAALAWRHGLRAERVVMLAPPLSIRDISLPVGDWLGLPRRVSERMLDRFARRLDVTWDEVRTDRMVSEIPVPVLVIHDEDDKVIPWSQGAAVARAAPRGTLRTTAGLGHRDVLVEPDVVRGVVEAISGPGLASVPPFRASPPVPLSLRERGNVRSPTVRRS